MPTTALKEIIAFLFGRKYYANIIATKGTDRKELCSYIFDSPEKALMHRMKIDETLSFVYVETISFRSRKVYHCGL